MLIRMLLTYFKEKLVMKNLLKLNYIFLLCSLLFSVSAYSETKLETICAESMADVSVLSSQEKNTSKIYKLINKEYKGVKLRKFLKKIWLVEIRKNKEFTPNSFYVKRDEYVKQCVQYVSGN